MDGPQQPYTQLTRKTYVAEMESGRLMANQGLPCGDGGGGSEEGGSGPAAARQRTLGRGRQPRPRETGDAAAAVAAVVDSLNRRRGAEGRRSARCEAVDAEAETAAVDIGEVAVGLARDGEERRGCSEDGWEDSGKRKHRFDCKRDLLSLIIHGRTIINYIGHKSKYKNKD
jgi:hypothetical protein